jgi:hypothetical protein
MRQGDTVTVVDVNDNKLVRVVVAVEWGFVYVSRTGEAKKAASEGREPNCIVFPLSDVYSVKNHR